MSVTGAGRFASGRRTGTPALAVGAWLLLAVGLADMPLSLAGSCALTALLLAFLWRVPGTAAVPERLHPGALAAAVPHTCLLGRGAALLPSHSAALHGAAEPAQALAKAPARQPGAPPARVPLALLQRHVLALGSPGSGKSSLLILLVWQAQRRREAVVVLDPKGSRQLEAHLADGAAAAGVPFLALRLDAGPGAVRYDPLRHCRDGNACADRLCGLIGDGRPDPFREFCWGAVATVCEALLAYGERPLLARLQVLLPEAGAALLAGAESLERPSAGDPAALAAEADPDLSPGRAAGAGAAEHESRERRRCALAALRVLVAHERGHYRKMTAPLLPVLAMLAGGVGARLLAAPADDEAAVHLDLARSRAQGATVYIGLDALGQAQLSHALAWLLLDDLACQAGQAWRARAPAVPLQLVVDEAGEVACDPLLRLLGKGREAGINVLLAMQTLADLEWRLRGRAAAQVALGNAAAWFLFRQLDAHSREESEARLGQLPVLRQSFSQTLGRTLGARHRRSSRSAGQTSSTQLLPRVPAALFTALRELECLAHLPDGQLLHVRLPLPAAPPHATRYPATRRAC